MTGNSSFDDRTSSFSPDTAFAGYVDRLLAGEQIDVDLIQDEHPEFGPDLIDQLRSFCDLANGANGSSSPQKLGDYEILRELGRGGMGVVYDAWQNSLGRQVALKILPAGVGSDTRRIARFVREAQISGKLNHPNIVSVYGMSVEGNVPYYSMEFVDGETLGQRIHRQRGKRDDNQLGMRQCIDLANAFAGVADGLHLAHQKSVVHRDIKPSNLIFDTSNRTPQAPDGELRILDFGLASFEGQDSLTISGEVVGTVRYMSPEQASVARSKNTVDHRTDIYSLGATLYEAVTLRAPLEGKDIADTLSQIASMDPVPPKLVNPLVPRDLETIILKCLRKVPSERYDTAAELGEDLRRFARGDAIKARPLSMLERVTRSCARYRRSDRCVHRHCTSCGARGLVVLVFLVGENRPSAS